MNVNSSKNKHNANDLKNAGEETTPNCIGKKIKR